MVERPIARGSPASSPVRPRVTSLALLAREGEGGEDVLSGVHDEVPLAVHLPRVGVIVTRDEDVLLRALDQVPPAVLLPQEHHRDLVHQVINITSEILHDIHT